MNPQTRYVAVGLFLLLGIAALVVSIVWLGQQGKTTPMVQYAVHIRSAVNGLSNGSTVRYMGVDAGWVLDIVLHTDTEPYVEVLIELDDSLPINDTTYATLVIQGVTGIGNIDLGSDPETARPLVSNSGGVAIIPFQSSGLSAVLAGGGDLTSAARRLLAQLNTWTGEENLERVVAILENVEQVTGTLADQREQIPGMVTSLKSTLERLDQTTEVLDAAIRNDLPPITGDLRQASAQLVTITGRVDEWLAANDQDVDRLLGEGLGTMTDLMIDLRGLSDRLSELTAKLREDPSRLVYRARHDPVVAEP